MKSIMSVIILAITIWVSICARCNCSHTAKQNIVIFLADDLGSADLGCLGNMTIRTPNIDKLAREGALLKHHLSADSVCTPSRAAMLTGRYPIRFGFGAPGTPMRLIHHVASTAGLPSEEVTFAEVAKDAGYTTAIIGKWHLGIYSSCSKADFHPLRQGFDYYFGIPLSSNMDFEEHGEQILLKLVPSIRRNLIVTVCAIFIFTTILYRTGILSTAATVIMLLLFSAPLLWFYVSFFRIDLIDNLLMRNFDVVEQPIKLETLSKRFVLESNDFIRMAHSEGKPFLLFVSWSHPHTALVTSKCFRGQSKHGRYGDTVEELDWSTGEILKEIERLGLAEDTFIYFSSDHGAHGTLTGKNKEAAGGYNGVFKGNKGDASGDGGIRAPGIMKWPGKIKPNTVIDEPTSLMDVFQVVAEITGSMSNKEHIVDGKNILPLVKGDVTVSPHEFLFHYCGHKIHAARYRPRIGAAVWKLVYKTDNYIPGTDRCVVEACFMEDVIDLDPPLLYEMTSDPGEQWPIKYNDNPEYKEIVSVIDEAVREHIQSFTPPELKLSMLNLMWIPWLQPCCNFPYCRCSDLKYSRVL